MEFNLTRPCKNCPFRKDRFFYLEPKRASEIALSMIRDGHTFPCHKTVNYDTDGNCGEEKDLSNTSHCAGALIILKKNNIPHRMTQIAERFGLYDPSKLDMNSPVYENFEEYVELLEEKERQLWKKD